MASGFTIGARVHIPELDGTWSIWSKAAEAPGAHFAIPTDDQARATGVKYAVIKTVFDKQKAKHVTQLIRTDPTRSNR